MRTQDCPCCGQALPIDGDLRIDDAGFVVRNGAVASLKPQEAALLDKLVSAAGRTVSKERLHRVVSRHNEDTEIKIVDILICTTRKKLKPLGLSIETVWGEGYRFIPITKRRVA